jgi:hypothetical protein
MRKEVWRKRLEKKLEKIRSEFLEEWVYENGKLVGVKVVFHE